MRPMRTIAGRLLSALLCAALVLGPVTAFAAPAAHGMHDAATSESAPCDMPCKGCADDASTPSCMVACLGLVAALPMIERVRLPHAMAHRIELTASGALAGVEREPDTPPPKFLLA